MPREMQPYLFSCWEEYTEKLEKICAAYDFPVQTLGESYLGRRIPMVRLGDGKHRILYVGTHHACEWLTGSLLLQFIDTYGTALQAGRCVCNVDLSFLYHTRSVWVIPVLNADGTELALRHGDRFNPLFDRVLLANHGNTDFSKWKANGRGVDLNRNYHAGFADCMRQTTQRMQLYGAPEGYCGTHPESEPEVLSLCQFIRRTVPLDLLLSFHTAGEEIFYTYKNYADARIRNIARILSRFSGYALSTPQPQAADGGLKDWYLQEYRAPAYTVECGRGKTPLPADQLPVIFERLKPMLFCGAVLS